MADVNLQASPFVGYEGRIYMGGYLAADATPLRHLTLNKWSQETEAGEIDTPTFDMPRDAFGSFTIPAVPGMLKSYFNFSGMFDRDRNPYTAAEANIYASGWCGGFFGLSQTVGFFVFGFYQRVNGGTDNSTQTGASDFNGRIRAIVTPRPPIADVIDGTDLATINALSASAAPVGSVRYIAAGGIKTYWMRVTVTGKTKFGGVSLPIQAASGSNPGGWIKVYVD